MGRIPHCKCCGEPILDKTQATKKGNYWYCNDCLEKKEAEQKDRKMLLDYIGELYNNQIPKYVYIQVEELKKKYDMKYQGMLLTLDYAFNYKEMTFDESKGIGIIPYLYDEAKNNWIKEQEIKKAVEEFEFDEKEVIISKRFDNNKKIKYKPIDMEDL